MLISNMLCLPEGFQRQYGNPRLRLTLDILGLLFSCWVVSDSCNLMDFSPPGSFIRGVLQARILEWVAISFSTGSSSPWDKTCISCLADRFFTSERPGKPFRSIREGKISGSLNSCLQEAHGLAGQTTCSTAPSEGCFQAVSPDVWFRKKRYRHH